MPSSRKKAPVQPTPWGVRTALIIAGVLVALVLGEMMVRILVPEPARPRVTQPPGFSPFTRTSKGVRIYTPDVLFSHVYDINADPRGYFGPDGRVDYRINNLGFRGEDMTVEKPRGIRRVLCLGDSFTFGEGVRENDAWPQRLGQILGAQTQVINAGIQGADLDSEGLFLLLYGRQLAPDVVVIAFFMNDAMPFEETVAHQGLLETPISTSKLGQYSAIWRLLVRRRLAASQTRRYLSDLRQSFASQQWRDARARIPRLRAMAEHDGFRIVAAIFPLLYALDGDYPLEREHVEARTAFADAGIEVVDLLETYRGHDAAELWAHATDPHPNEIAQRMAAERIARVLAVH
jgi:lysophospholipase L1-like esterase